MRAYARFPRGTAISKIAGAQGLARTKLLESGDIQ
jgi:hypothetical protein